MAAPASSGPARGTNSKAPPTVPSINANGTRIAPKNAEYITSESAARVNCARMNWASIWFRSWSTSCRNSRWERDCTSGNQHFMKVAAIAQKKNGQDGHQKQHPDFFRRLRRAHAGALRQVSQISATADQKTLYTLLGLIAPATLVSKRVANWPIWPESWPVLALSTSPGSVAASRALWRAILGPTGTPNTTRAKEEADKWP